MRVKYDQQPFTFDGERLTELAMPLGGIGTGCISLEGRGVLRDWEIYGRPNKNTFLENTFCAIWTRTAGGKVDARGLHGPRLKEFLGVGAGYGTGHLYQGEGLPSFASASCVATFPFLRTQLERDGYPLEVELEAFSPFVPPADRESSMPAASLSYRLRNRTTHRVDAVLCWSVMNPVGGSEHDPDPRQDRATAAFVNEAGCRGILFGNQKYAPEDVHAGSFALTTDWDDVTFCERWFEGSWFDALQDFWNRFAPNGELNESAPNPTGYRMPASLGLRVSLEPGESAVLPFLLSWVFPNADRYWDTKFEPSAGVWTRYYATQWPNAWEVAQEFFARKDELTTRSLEFESRLFGSGLPPEIAASVGYTTSILRTPTVDRLTDGTLWAWEGCNEKAGCCHGSCSHVWNYALTHEMLFPNLALSMLKTHFDQGFHCGPAGEKGAMNFRIMLPVSGGSPLWHAAVDGQLGLILQLARTWRRTGDAALLAEYWPKAKQALRYAWEQWDRDKDGLVEGDMHNTYDINFQGPNPLGQFFYLGALRACAEMATAVGEHDWARELAELAERGRALAEKKLWNGEFFVQRLEDVDGEPKYQHGIGCLSDQVFGVLCARLAGIDDVVDTEMVRSSLTAIFRHNFRSPIGDHTNLQRSYAAPDESGLLLCSWPNGGRPEYPFVYSDEVWTGIEYQVSTHLAMEGLREEALAIVAAIRTRYDGRRRNPYNEVECGSHYARALASFGLWQAFGGPDLHDSGISN